MAGLAIQALRLAANPAAQVLLVPPPRIERGSAV